MSGLSTRAAAGLACAIALILGGAVQALNVLSLDSPASILRVGASSPVRGPIEADLGAVPVTVGGGHDGQYFYVSARDPFALDDQRVDTYTSYRHRRVGYPLLAGLGSSLSPQLTLLGLIVVPIFGLGAAAAAAVAMVAPAGRQLALVSVLANPGLWFSVSLATGDSVALAAGLGALLALRFKKTWPAVVLLTVAGLTKETHLVFTAAAAGWLLLRGGRRNAMIVGGVPLGIYGAWLAWLGSRVPSDGVGLWNFDWPGVGLVEAAMNASGADLVLIAVGLAGVIIAIVGAALARSLLLRLATIPWIVIALVSSEIVWREGNNVVRVMAPVLTLGVLALLADEDPVAHPPSTSRKNLPV